MTTAQPTAVPANFTRRSEFLSGIKDTFPLIIGAVPFGIIFGAVAVTGGLSPLAVQGMSLFVFAGSAQFIAAGLYTQGVAGLLIIFTTFIVNIRHALYAASLAPYLRGKPQRWMLPLGFWLTDETYAIVVRRYPQPDDSPYKHWYHLGSSISMYLNWQLCTLIGIVAGTQLQGLAELGLDFAMVITFIGIVVPLINGRPMLAAALTSAVVAVLTYPLPNQVYLMLAALSGIAVGYLLETRARRAA